MFKNPFPKSAKNFQIYGMGLKAHNIGDFKGAIYCFTKVLESEPKINFSWYLLLESLSYLDKWEQMIEYGKKALRIHKNFAPIYLWLGEAYVNLKEEKQGRKTFKKGLNLLEKELERYPKCDAILNSIGEINLKLVKYEEAIKYLKKAADLNPNSEHHLHGIGYAYKEMGQYDKAIEYFEKSLSINPKHSYAWFDLGLVYEILNTPDKAINYFEKAVENSPQWVKLRQKLTKMRPNSLVLLKKPPDIRITFNKAIAREHAEAESLYEELNEISTLLKENSLLEEERKYHEKRMMEVKKDLEFNLTPLEEKLRDLKKLLTEAHELIIKSNNATNEQDKIKFYKRLKEIANLVEEKRRKIYRTEKSFNTIVNIPYIGIGPKLLRTMWECMKLTASNPEEFLDLMKQETDFYKEMIAMAEESFNKAEKFDNFKPKGIIEKIAWRKTKKEMEELEQKKKNQNIERDNFEE